MISIETVKEFQEAIASTRGVNLSDKEASEILQNWVGYFDLLGEIDYRDKNQASHSTSN